MIKGNIKINQEVANRIRDEYYIPGVTAKSLAEKYGVCISTISNIITFKTWRG